MVLFAGLAGAMLFVVRTLPFDVAVGALRSWADALRTTLRAYLDHFHGERNHQDKDNLLLFPTEEIQAEGVVRYRERLGGLLKCYHRAAA